MCVAPVILPSVTPIPHSELTAKRRENNSLHMIGPNFGNLVAPFFHCLILLRRKQKGRGFRARAWSAQVCKPSAIQLRWTFLRSPSRDGGTGRPSGLKIGYHLSLKSK